MEFYIVFFLGFIIIVVVVIIVVADAIQLQFSILWVSFEALKLIK